MTSDILDCFLKWKKVEDLIEDAFYEFKVAAANLVGIGQPSDPSEHFKCKAWTMPEPGKSISSSWILIQYKVLKTQPQSSTKLCRMSFA